MPMSAPHGVLSWLEVGRPPDLIGLQQKQRQDKIRLYGGVVGAVIVATFGASAIYILWPGVTSLSTPVMVAVLATSAVAIGAASFLTNLWMLPWLDRLTTLQARRVALSGGKLYLEQASGKVFEIPLEQVSVVQAEAVPGWVKVEIRSGGSLVTFLVPRFIGSTIRNALSG